MKDHVNIGHLPKCYAFRVNRDQVMKFIIWFKIHTNGSNFETASPKTIKTLKISYQFCDNRKISLCTYYLKEAEMKIAMIAHLNSITEIIKNLRVCMILGSLFALAASYLVK